MKNCFVIPTNSNTFSVWRKGRNLNILCLNLATKITSSSFSIAVARKEIKQQNMVFLVKCRALEEAEVAKVALLF